MNSARPATPIPKMRRRSINLGANLTAKEFNNFEDLYQSILAFQPKLPELPETKEAELPFYFNLPPAPPLVRCNSTPIPSAVPPVSKIERSSSSPSSTTAKVEIVLRGHSPLVVSTEEYTSVTANMLAQTNRVDLCHVRHILVERKKRQLEESKKVEEDSPVAVSDDKRQKMSPVNS